MISDACMDHMQAFFFVKTNQMSAIFKQASFFVGGK
jgi:hypothetical protein